MTYRLETAGAAPIEAGLRPIGWIEVRPDDVVILHHSVLSVDALNAAVAGDFEQAPPLDTPDAMFIPSVKAGRSYNRIATTLVSRSLMPGDKIGGTVVIVGPPDEVGDPTSYTPEVEQAIMALHPRQ